MKDRLAHAIIVDAEARGTIKPGHMVVEATSGNTGIALAIVCAAKGYPFVSFMVETFSIERRKLMRMLGAKVILPRLPNGLRAWSRGGRCREARPPRDRIVTTEPAGAQLLAGKNCPHKIRGRTQTSSAVLDPTVFDDNIPVTDDDARDWARALACRDGILTGISGGGTFAAAMQLAIHTARPGDVILAMLPDPGERELSTFFEGINKGSDDDWLASLD